MIRFILIIATIILSVFLLSVNKKRQYVGIYSSVLFTLIFYYFVIPIIILSMNVNLESGGYVLSWMKKLNFQTFIFTYSLIAIFLFSFSIAYTHTFKKNNRLALKASDFLKRSNQFGLVLLLIGGISLVLYIRSFGGLQRLLMYAEYLRSFSTDAAEFVSYADKILIIPARLVTVVPVLMLLTYSYKSNSRLLYGLLFIISLLLAFVFNLINAGRTGMIIFLLMFFIPWLSEQTRYPYIITILVAIFGISILDTLDALFASFSTGEQVSFEVGANFTNYVNQFAYPINNAFYCDDIVSKYGFRYGKDFILGPLTIIPGFNYDPSYVPVSAFHGGANWKSGGGTPVDVITFSYMQFGFLGPAIVGGLIGFIVGKADVLIKSLHSSYANNVFKVALMLSYFTMIVNTDIASIIRGQFILVIPSFLLFYSKSANVKYINSINRNSYTNLKYPSTIINNGKKTTN